MANCILLRNNRVILNFIEKVIIVYFDHILSPCPNSPHILFICPPKKKKPLKINNLKAKYPNKRHTKNSGAFLFVCFLIPISGRWIYLGPHWGKLIFFLKQTSFVSRFLVRGVNIRISVLLCVDNTFGVSHHLWILESFLLLLLMDLEP